MSSNNPHPIFVQARKNSKINPQDLLSILWDSAADHKSFSDYLTKFIQNDLSTPPLFTERSRKDQYQRVIENSPKLLKTMDVDFGLKMPPDPYLNDVTPIIGGVGLGMNLPLLYLCGTEEQKQKWIPRIQNGDILSAYGQTEIGHGSDVQSLETTATYDENKEIFVINSPSVSAYKFWPGDLGKNSNWVVVYARVITKGQFRGVYPLFFQIRDMDTHKLFDGVDGGDIGPKLGYNFKENGFLGFQNFKVPREALLAKFVSVERDGTFKVHGN